MKTQKPIEAISRLHDSPAVIAKNNFIHKSLSNFSYNPYMGCAHACTICYVPDTSTGKQAVLLSSYGVENPIRQWGQYVLVRPWDEAKFMASLRKAANTDPRLLKPDGHRAVMMCSTTDPYQTIKNPDAKTQTRLNKLARQTMRRALVAIRDHSDLNVRILTRSPLAEADFDLMESFGDRLMFGMSIPTLDRKIQGVFEPKAPHPKQRLKTLIAAHNAGIPTYVAIAPVYPGCDEDDLRKTMTELKEANPMTLFYEPVNIRQGIVERIAAQAKEDGVEMDLSPFHDTKSWAPYARGSLLMAERIAEELDLTERLHLWPDESLKSQKALLEVDDPLQHMRWLNKWWSRISEWPGIPAG